MDCPQLSKTIKTCTNNDNKCYKVTLPGGAARGCARRKVEAAGGP